MKTFNLILILFALCGTNLFAQAVDENKAIEETILNYIEGWYDGDVDRMEKALHPELAKRVLATLPQTGTTFINTATKSMMVEYTRAGFGKQTPREKLNNTVEILDVYNGIATVKAISYDYVDYCHVVKQDGEWKIINVLWERIPHEKEE